MPWSNQSGGGGGNGGGWKPGGPWGQPPRNGSGGGGGGRPSDLEDLLRRGQDRLRRVLPGGPGGSSNNVLIGSVAIGLLALVWLYNCIYFVQPQQVGVELRFGEVKPELNGPGPHFHWWPVESVELPAVLQENQENIGFSGNRTSGDSALMLSGDQNLVEVEFSVLWRIDDPVAYLFNVADQEDIVRMVAEASMREYVGQTNADEFRTTGRESAQAAVRQLTQDTLNAYDAGIVITGINLERADPPQEVIDAFEEVQRAQQDQARFQQEALAYANQRLGDARGQAAQVRETASGYRERVVAEATGEAERFRSVHSQYVEAPDVTRRRLYLETLSEVLANSDKVILDQQGGDGVLPYLPLPEVNRRNGGNR